MTNAVLALGSNVGDRAGIILAAIEDLRHSVGISHVRPSDLRESIALTSNGPDQSAPRFMNAVVQVETTLTPHELLATALRIEQGHGRVRHEKWGPRTLDIDVITYADLQMTEPDLVIPHPEAYLRPFVLEPWLELDPTATIPGHGSVADLVRHLPDSGLVRVERDART